MPRPFDLPDFHPIPVPVLNPNQTRSLPASEEVCLLGIDPGLEKMGYGCVRCRGDRLDLIDFGILRSPQKKPIAQRLGQIGRQLGEVMTRLSPDICVIEDVFVMKYARPALTLAHARGVSLYVADQYGCPVHMYTTRFIKKSVCGYGNATKSQVVYMVRHLLSYNQAIPEDAADALAAAICHGLIGRHQRRLDELQP